jgi:hypothetical protein
MVAKRSKFAGMDMSEFRRAGVFETRLTLLVSQELNRRKIRHRLEDVDGLTTVVYVATGSAAEATQCIEEIKRRNRRVRL